MGRLLEDRDMLAEYGNGDKRTIGNGATREQILERISEFSGLTKRMLEQHERMVKYLSTHKFKN